MAAGHGLQWAGWLTLYSHLAGVLGLVGMLVVLGIAYWFDECLDHFDDEWAKGHKYTEDERREIDEERDRNHAAAVASYPDRLAEYRGDEAWRPTEPTRGDRLQEGDRSGRGDRYGFAFVLLLFTVGSMAAVVLSWMKCPAVWSWDHAVEARIEGNTTSRGMLQLNIGGGGWGAVCTDSFDAGEANAFCQLLGFGGGAFYSTPLGDGMSYAAAGIDCNRYYDCEYQSRRCLRSCCTGNVVTGTGCDGCNRYECNEAGGCAAGDSSYPGADACGSSEAVGLQCNNETSTVGLTCPSAVGGAEMPFAMPMGLSTVDYSSIRYYSSQEIIRGDSSSLFENLKFAPGCQF